MENNRDRNFAFPQQQLSYAKKNNAWRRRCVDWACNKTYYSYEPVRKSVTHKKINFDLVNGKLHIEDMKRIVAPDRRSIGFKPEEIQHYPIINPKINLLVGEERKRVFEHKIVVTNPNGVSEIEQNRRDEIRKRYEAYLAGDPNQQEGQDAVQVNRINDYMTYEWQDIREIRANALLNHYDKEQNFGMLFNQGFEDAIINSEEIYICDIVCDEPVLTKLNPMEVHAFRSGYSSKIEDADVVVIESYWSVGKVIDWFHESLSASDIKKLEAKAGDGDDFESTEENFIEQIYNPSFVGEDGIMSSVESPEEFAYGDNSLSPYDPAGNIRVVRVFWKSRKKILKVKSYDPETGEEIYNIYPEDHIIDPSLGEEATPLWVNEAWEGTKIGSDIYVDIRPRKVQYNSLTNPSRCHFGIVGTIYNLNGAKPFSLVDMMKPYNYLYDIIHDRLNKLIARNWGAIMKLDLAQVPEGWDITKWLYFAKESGIAVSDSFKEGNSGVATGKLAGSLNNNSNGVINLDDSRSIGQNIELLNFIQQEMSQVVGISAQREGSIENRETVGGVERATVQSAHITEWLFSVHNDTKKRVYECFLETAKAAMRGKNKKFQYLLSDGSMQLVNIDGDEFAECDYGLVCDYSNDAQKLQQSIEMLAQAALQNQMLDFSTIMKLYNTSSLAEKQRIVEKAEKDAKAQAQQVQQEQMQQAQQQLQAQQQANQAKLEAEERQNAQDNETRIRVAEIEAQGRIEASAAQSMYRNDDNASEERRRQFDAKMDLERRKLEFQQRKADKDRDAKMSIERAKGSSEDANKYLDRKLSEIQNQRSEANKYAINERNIQSQSQLSKQRNQ